MVIPTGSPDFNKNKYLGEIETTEIPNENQCNATASVSNYNHQERIVQNKIAATTVIVSSNKDSQVLTTDAPYQPVDSDAIRTAALWYSDNHFKRSGAFIPFLRVTFALTPLEAIRAMQLGRQLVQEARRK